MVNQGAPILIVSDSPARSVQIEKLLVNSGFANVNSCRGTVSALQYAEHHPIQVLVGEWSAKDVTGLEMAINLRDIQSDQFRFTYTILIITDESDDDIHVALEENVDNVILMKDLNSHILPKVKAGARISNQINQLLSTNRLLMEECNQLQMGQMLDPLTGLGNVRQARQGLQGSIRQIDSRGGAVSFLLIKVCNYRAVVERYDQRIANELIIAVSERIQQLVRPLDIVTYFDTALFAVVLLQPRVEDCTVEAFQRLFDGIRLKGYTTSIGFLSASVAMSICASGAETGPPKASVIISTAQENMALAENTGEIQVVPLLPL